MKCRNCGAGLADNAGYCASCGSPTGVQRVMPEQVGSAPPPAAEAPVAQTATAVAASPATAPTKPDVPEPDGAADNDVYLDPIRIAFLTLVSGGWYTFYWSYLTWKQLQRETGEQHFAVWHALTQCVPIYGLFRLHKHAQVIRDLNVKAGLAPEPQPFIVVVGFIIDSYLSFSLLRNMDNMMASLVMTLIGIGFVVGAMCWAQSALNRYWLRTRGETVSEAGFGVGEIAITVIGAATWLLYL